MNSPEGIVQRWGKIFRSSTAKRPASSLWSERVSRSRMKARMMPMLTWIAWPASQDAGQHRHTVLGECVGGISARPQLEITNCDLKFWNSFGVKAVFLER